MVPSGFDHSLAIIIGINNYSNGISPLKTLSADAEAMICILEADYQYRSR